jgi:heme-degrading monooxygenase HmoA
VAELKWKSYAKASQDREYLALISYLPLKSLWKLPKFLLFTRANQTQLKESKGLIGYSFLAHFLQGRFWTLSVWEDENALMEFVRSRAHRQTMSGLRGHLGETKFVKWNIYGSPVPPTWEESLKRLG